jgi:hypothetical protein
MDPDPNSAISVWYLAIFLAMSCMARRGPDITSVSFGMSLDFSEQTKQLRIAATCGTRQGC